MGGWREDEGKWPCGHTPIEERVQPIEDTGDVKIIEVPREWAAKIVYHDGIVHGWFDGEVTVGKKKFIKFKPIRERYGCVDEAIYEACEDAGCKARKIADAPYWIAKKEFYKQG